MVSRLAAGLLVDPGEAVPLTLDEDLGSADLEHTDRGNTLLAAAGDYRQVILLTCDPTRFAGILDAAVLLLT